MAIEIRQLLIKSTVLQSGSSENESGFEGAETHFDTELLKQEIVADCRALFQEMLRVQKER